MVCVFPGTCRLVGQVSAVVVVIAVLLLVLVGGFGVCGLCVVMIC